MKTLTPNIYKLEIDITFKCTLKCFNCNRGLSIVDGREEENMSLTQFSKFIAQSIENQHLWKQIRIMGGSLPFIPISMKLLKDYIYIRQSLTEI